MDLERSRAGNGPVTRGATRCLLSGLIDDAALFPPGNAPMAAAVSAHDAHERSWYGAFIGPFLCPDVRLPELVGALPRRKTYRTFARGRHRHRRRAGGRRGRRHCGGRATTGPGTSWAGPGKAHSYSAVSSSREACIALAASRILVALSASNRASAASSP